MSPHGYFCSLTLMEVVIDTNTPMEVDFNTNTPMKVGINTNNLMEVGIDPNTVLFQFLQLYQFLTTIHYNLFSYPLETQEILCIIFFPKKFCSMEIGPELRVRIGS